MLTYFLFKIELTYFFIFNYISRMSRTLASIATLNINNVATISGLAKLDSFTRMPDDIIRLIAIYTLPNNFNKSELKINSKASQSKYFIIAMTEQWNWFNSSLNWASYLQKYMDDSELIYLYNTLTNCRCCKRHQDYKGINKANYLAKDRKCNCVCRHQKRWVERVLINKGYRTPLPHCYNCDTEINWSLIQKKIATEHGDIALRHNY